MMLDTDTFVIFKTKCYLTRIVLVHNADCLSTIFLFVLLPVLSRYHGNTSSLRLSNSHHVEDEVISSSSVLSTGR